MKSFTGLGAGSTTETTTIALGAATTDRRRLFRLMECHLLHRTDWVYLGTRPEDGSAPWPTDLYRCDQCERAWETGS